MATNRTEVEAEGRFPLSTPALLLYFNQKHFLKHPNSMFLHCYQETRKCLALPMIAEEWLF